MAAAHDAWTESHTGTTGSVSVASFTFTHTPVGTPRGVLVFVLSIAAVDKSTGVTYGGVAMERIPYASAWDTATEPAFVAAFFLGASVPTGAQSVVVSRVNDATQVYANSVTVTAGADTEPIGYVTQSEDGAVAEVSVTDGNVGLGAIRYCGDFTGANAPLAAGASSTSLGSIDFGSFGWAMYRETTAGTGARNVGPTATGSNNRALSALCIREISGGPKPLHVPVYPQVLAQ